MTDLYTAAQEKFPVNILVALVVGLIIGYFIATFVSGGVGGKATGEGFTQSCGNGIREGYETCDNSSMPCPVIVGTPFYFSAPCNSNCSGFNYSVCPPDLKDLFKNLPPDEIKKLIDPNNPPDSPFNKLYQPTICHVLTDFKPGCNLFGYPGGTLNCGTVVWTDTIHVVRWYDTAGCTNTPVCGNHIKEKGEDCDGGDFGGASTSCTDYDFFKGTVTCGSDCYLDLSACTDCGNNAVDADETCDYVNGAQQLRTNIHCNYWKCNANTCHLDYAYGCGW